MTPLYDSSGAREIDRLTMTEFGLPGAALMEQAGRAVAEAAMAAVDAREPGSEVVVLCGKGNNGGDGYVAARWLQHFGVTPRVYTFADPNDVSGDAAGAFDLWQKTGPYTDVIAPESFDVAQLELAFPGDNLVVVDALFGTGLQSTLRDPYPEILGMLDAYFREIGATVIAIDIPSGIDAGSGRVLGAALHADITVTMGFEKLGLRVYPGAGYCGDINVVDLGYPASVMDMVPAVARLLDDDTAALWLPRPRDGHKGTFGSVLVIAGSRSMPGAAELVARGALRTGCGKALVYSEAGGHAVLGPEMLRLGGEKTWAEVEVADLQDASEPADVVACGPGIGRDPAILKCLAAFFTECSKPLLLDADALWALPLLNDRPLPRGTVLTPHPGEAAMLLGSTAASVQADRVGAITEMQNRWPGSVVVLKGAGSLTASEAGLAVSPVADPALAVPGSGDVLAGIIAALMAQGVSSDTAAELGVWLHGMTRTHLHATGNLAHEIADAIPLCIP